MAESLARKSFFSTLINLVGAVIAYVGILTISKYMGSSAVFTIGLIGFTSSYVGVYLPVSRLGFQTAHIKKVSEGADLGQCNGSFLLITALLTGLMSFLVFGTIFFWIYVLGKGFESPLEVQGIWIMLAYTIISTLATVPASTFNARRETVKAQIGTFAGHIVRVIAIIFVVFSKLSPIDVIWTYLLGGVASTAVTFYYFRGYPVSKPSKELIREYRKFADPLLIPSLIGLLPTSLSVVLVELFWHLAGAGQFYASYRIASVFVVLGGSVTSVVFPRISELHSMGKHLQIRESTLTSEYFLSFVLAPLSLFMVFFPIGILHVILSNHFYGAATPLAILAVWLYVTSISGPKNSVITGMNRPKISAWITIVSTLVSLAVMVVAIPVSIFGIPLPGIGPAGAALGLLAGAVVLYAMSQYHSKKLADTHFDFSVVYFFIIAVISDLMVMPLTLLIPLQQWRWYDAVFFALVSGAVYLVLCLLSRIASIEDLKVYIDALNPLAMHRYVSDELSSDFKGDRR